MTQTTRGREDDKTTKGKDARSGEPKEEVMATTPSNPDAWQGAELANAVRNYEAPPDPIVLASYADNTKEQQEAREKANKEADKANAETNARIKKDEEEAKAKK